jgi:Activator of Hsp90 ATPase homolog 1-like protein
MAQAKSGPRQIISRDHSDDPVAAVGGHSDVAIPREAKESREVRQKIRIDAVSATVFALLTDPRRMMTWLAREVAADPHVGGIFRLADFNGLWIEGIYDKVHAARR